MSTAPVISNLDIIRSLLTNGWDTDTLVRRLMEIGAERLDLADGQATRRPAYVFPDGVGVVATRRGPKLIRKRDMREGSYVWGEIGSDGEVRQYWFDL